MVALVNWDHIPSTTAAIYKILEHLYHLIDVFKTMSHCAIDGYLFGYLETAYYSQPQVRAISTVIGPTKISGLGNAAKVGATHARYSTIPGELIPIKLIPVWLVDSKRFSS